jgi:hypothetical protein
MLELATRMFHRLHQSRKSFSAADGGSGPRRESRQELPSETSGAFARFLREFQAQNVDEFQAWIIEEASRNRRP